MEKVVKMRGLIIGLVLLCGIVSAQGDISIEQEIKNLFLIVIVMTAALLSIIIGTKLLLSLWRQRRAQMGLIKSIVTLPLIFVAAWFALIHFFPFSFIYGILAFLIWWWYQKPREFLHSVDGVYALSYFTITDGALALFRKKDIDTLKRKNIGLLTTKDNYDKYASFFDNRLVSMEEDGPTEIDIARRNGTPLIVEDKLMDAYKDINDIKIIRFSDFHRSVLR